jgi:hypothetical protein
MLMHLLGVIRFLKILVAFTCKKLLPQKILSKYLQCMDQTHRFNTYQVAMQSLTLCLPRWLTEFLRSSPKPLIKNTPPWTSQPATVECVNVIFRHNRPALRSFWKYSMTCSTRTPINYIKNIRKFLIKYPYGWMYQLRCCSYSKCEVVPILN